MLTLQVLAEKQYGFTMRRTAELARAREDEMAAQMMGLADGPR